MDCWGRFDRKTVLYFTGNRNSRVPGMEKELSRVGLGDAERQWSFPSPIDRTIRKEIPHAKNVESDGYFNCSMGHYRAIATAYHLGSEHALFLEDDIRFLNDLTEVEKAVSDLPEDYDVAMLDWFCIKKRDGSGIEKARRWRDERKVNGHWSAFDKLYSAGCYALSRRGMKGIMRAFELSATDRIVGKFRIIDHYMDRNVIGQDARLYFAGFNVAVQREMGASNSAGYRITDKYKALGIRLDQYAKA